MARKYPAETIATFLGRTALLKECAPDQLLALAGGADQGSYEPGAVMLDAGRSVSGLGVLLKGRAELQVVDAASGNRRKLTQLIPGDLYGEVGLLLGGGNPTAVVAEEECVTATLPLAAVKQALGRNAALGQALARLIASRFVQVSVLGVGAGAAPPPPETPPPPAEADAPRPEGQVIWVDVGAYTLSPEVIGMIPPELIRKHRMLPLQLGPKTLTVGMVNPRSVEGLQALRRVLHSVDPDVVAISEDDFNQTFVRLKLDAKNIKAPRRRVGREQPLTYAVEQEKEAEKGQLIIGSEVVSIFDRILLEGLELGASDIHIEPESTSVRVRYRVHGGLHERQEVISPTYAVPLIARIKVLAQLDITERRLPQDGRMMAKLGNRELNLRISTMAVARGEKAVIRVIDPADVMRPLRQIFLNPEQEQATTSSLAAPYGAILVAGPTGSGKSSTLYSMLNERKLGRPDTNIVTVEDPVEYYLQGVTQVPVIERVNFNFATALRGLVRQDPDVIMIGELRDRETTSIMIESALTGHLVLTSIHGNDVAGVIQRLQHLGTDAVLMSQALQLIVVQRLAQRLCPNCVTDGEVAPALLENLVARKVIARGGAIKLPRPAGCDACGKTGYVGRVAVQETLYVDDAVRIALGAGTPTAELLEQAQKRKRYVSFAQAATFLMARRVLAPSDALLIVTD